MNPLMLLKIALHSLRANALRSLLTMLGIIIGVSAVISMVSIGDGAKARVAKRIQGMGTNLLIVRPGQRRRRRVRGGSVNTLTRADADAIAAQIPGVQYVSPEMSQSQQVKYLNENMPTTILGATASYLQVNGFKLGHGRFFGETDLRANRKVAVLGATVAKQLFAGRDPVGKDIKIKGINFTVIGALEAKGQSGYRDPDDMVLIPLRVAQLRVFGTRYLRAINVQVASQKWMDDVQADITRLLRQRHRLAGKEDDFNIRNQKEILETMNEVTGTFTLLLASIALVSLLVGGIGIMNIMLVSNAPARSASARPSAPAPKTSCASSSSSPCCSPSSADSSASAWASAPPCSSPPWAHGRPNSPSKPSSWPSHSPSSSASSSASTPPKRRPGSTPLKLSGMNSIWHLALGIWLRASHPRTFHPRMSRQSSWPVYHSG